MARIKSININAGHNAAGQNACGAVSLLNESKENRKVVKRVTNILKKNGVKVYNCTVDKAPSQRDNLVKICKLCEEHKVDLNVFVHFDCCVNDLKGDGKTSGTSCLVKTNLGIRKKASEAIRRNISKIGFKDRGTHETNNLYVLNHTSSPCVLIECCFVDDADDVKLYNYKTMGDAIAKAILEVKF